MSKYYLKERLMDGFMIVFDSILAQNKFGTFFGVGNHINIIKDNNTSEIVSMISISK